MVLHRCCCNVNDAGTYFYCYLRGNVDGGAKPFLNNVRCGLFQHDSLLCSVSCTFIECNCYFLAKHSPLFWGQQCHQSSYFIHIRLRNTAAWIREHVSCTQEALFQASSGSLPGSLENLTIAIFFKNRMAESQNDPLVSIAKG